MTDIRLNEGRTWDWKNRIVYLPELDSNRLEHVMSVEGLLVEVKLEAPSVLQPALSRQRFVPVIGRLSRMVNHAPVRFGPSNDGNRCELANRQHVVGRGGPKIRQPDEVDGERYNEAARETRKALDLDPHYSLGHFNLGMILSAAGSLPEAAAALARAREYGPANLDALAFLGHVYGRMGRSTEARAILDSLRATSEARYVSPYARALVHVGLGELDEALDQLEQAYEDRSWFTTLLKVDPAFDLLRQEPRFESLLKRVGLSGTA